MITDLSYLTVAEFEAIAQRVVAEHPNRRNPVADLDGVVGCAYRDDAGESCLIGHILLHELGVEYDSTWENMNASSVLDRFDASKEVRIAASRLQAMADRYDLVNDVPSSTRVTWAEAWDAYRNEPR